MKMPNAVLDSMQDADWKGRTERRFRWRTLRFEWGRWCYQTNWCGDTLAAWFEWEYNGLITGAPLSAKKGDA